MSKSILITGSTGMVGKNIVRELQKKNFTLLRPFRSELDLTRTEDVNDYFKKNQIDIIIHAAGLVGGIQANIEKPYSFLNVNSLMALNVINAAIENRIQKFINLGSSCMYPKDCNGKLDENMILSGPLEPTNEGYAISKILAHKLCEYAKKEFELNYKTIIPCNLFGEFDNFHPKESHMIPAVIRKIHFAKKLNENVRIWGSGNVRREIMYVGDLVDFLIWSIENYETLPDTMNIGLGKDYTINEYYEIISNIIGFKGSFLNDLSKPEGMKRKLCSITRQNSLGWKPKHTIHEGIEKTYKFYLDTNEI